MSRSRTLRLFALCVMLALPLAALCTGGAQLVPFLALPLVVLGGPMLFDLKNGPDPESDADDDSDSDDGPGGNKRPGRGPTTPSGPLGELPLEFSSPGSWRLRGTSRQTTRDPGKRRAPHRPAPQTPRRVPAGPHR